MKEKALDNQGIVSVIVPVYNVEKYLAECLESVMAQTYPYLEVIIVDDGSTDSSGSIADAFGERDHRIKVFHKENAGAASARNYALRVCTGEFISFIDSDDWIENHTIEKALLKLQESGADIVQFQMIQEKVDQTAIHRLIEEEKLFSDEEFIKDALTNWEDLLSCIKVFKRKTIENVFYEEGHCIDDEYFTYKTVMNADKVLMIPDALYHYRIRGSSAMRDSEKKRQRFLDQIDFVTKRYPVLAEAYPKLESEVLEHLIGVLIHVIKSTKFPDVVRKGKKELWRYGIKGLFDPRVSSETKKNTVKYLLINKTNGSAPANVNKKDEYFE